MSSMQSGDSVDTTSQHRAKVRMPPIGFWSYARQDDELSNGDLTQLRTQVRSALQRQFGRTPIEIFQDTSAIPHGAKWEREIRHSLFNATFFIPILTPNFLQSEWCCREVQLFLERQQQLFDTYPDLPRESRIFPILYVDVRRADTIDPAVAATLNSLQSFDFRELQYETAAPTVRKAIASFATSIRDLLLIEVDSPPSPDEIAAAQAAADAAARAEAAAKALAERNALTSDYQRDRKRFDAIADRLDPAFGHSKAHAEQRTEEAKAKAKEAEDRARLDAAMKEAIERQRLMDEHDRRLREATAGAAMPAPPPAQARAPRASGRWLAIGAGVIGALMLLIIVLRGTGGGDPEPASPEPPDNAATQNATDTAGGSDAKPDSPPAPAKPRFAAESWITAHSWAAGRNCGAPVSFSIEGNDLIVVQGGTPERHAIDAAKSTDNRLVADGLTLSRRSASATDSPITMIYPDFKVEVLACAIRR